MRKGTIYTITNLIDGKQYVGKTSSDPQKYWRWHVSRAERGVDPSKLLYRAMSKHGIENFSFDILVQIPRNELKEFNNELDRLETHYIEKLNTYNNGYNMTLGGDGAAGAVRSQEFKDNLRVIKTGVKRPEWVKQKMRMPKSEEHKRKLSVPKSEEHKNKLKDIWKNKSKEEKDAIWQKCVANRRDYNGENNPFYNREHSQEFIDYITEYNTELQNRPEIKLENKMKQPNRIEVYAIALDGSVIYHFISAREAKRWIATNTRHKGDVSSILNASKKNGKYLDYIWRRDLEDVETNEKVVHYLEDVQ